MRSTRWVTLAVLAALPLAATAAGAAPAAPTTASAVSRIDAGQPLINVGRRGGGGHGGHGHGGGHGGHGHGGHGHHGPGGGHWHGGGGHWQGGHGHNHHFRPRFYPGWYGVPYYGGYGYGPAYYDYYDDEDDDAVVYSDSGDAVARCEARYRSFDRRSGTFLSTNGTRKICPYLR